MGVIPILLDLSTHDDDYLSLRSSMALAVISQDLDDPESILDRLDEFVGEQFTEFLAMVSCILAIVDWSKFMWPL